MNVKHNVELNLLSVLFENSFCRRLIKPDLAVADMCKVQGFVLIFSTVITVKAAAAAEVAAAATAKSNTLACGSNKVHLSILSPNLTAKRHGYVQSESGDERKWKAQLISGFLKPYFELS